MWIIKQLLTRPLSAVGFFLLFAFVVIAVIAPWIAPPQYAHEPYRIPRDGYWAEPKPPSEAHILGTAEGQYDIFYGVVWGTRTAFRVGIIVTLCACAIGITIGSIAAYYGGIVDEILMRIVDIFYTLPFLVAAMVLTVVLGRSLTNSMIALISFTWMGYARVIRSEILRIKELDYSQAARSIGANNFRILRRHIIPNALYPVFVMVSMNIGSMVIAVSTLSFLGLGAEVGFADWGQMISLARNWMLGGAGNATKYWFTVVCPGLPIILFVLAWNLVGDSLRDVLDPRMRGSR
ncbi:ABC transporter permease [Candidatus Bipolaricaulota bacterium]